MSSGSDSDDTVEWDHVAIPSEDQQDQDQDQERRPIQVVLQTSTPNKLASASSEAAVSSYKLRIERIAIHKAHLICLVTAASVRNAMLNDELLQARLMSKTPLRLQNAFHSYSVRTHPNERDRSRLFDAALRDLCRWWFLSFEVDASTGIRYRSWKELQKEIHEYRKLHPYDSRSALPEDYTDSKLGYHEHFVPSFRKGEPVRSVNSLMKRAVLMSGSSDMSAQLFTALCRSIDIPARLVFSLQPISGKLSADKSSSSSGSIKKRPTEYIYEPPSPDSGSVEVFPNRNSNTVVNLSSSASSPSIVILEPSHQNSPSSSTKTSTSRQQSASSRNSKSKKQQTVLSKARKPIKKEKAPPPPSPPRVSSSSELEDSNEPPIFWTEVFCRTTKEWITVDPIRGNIRCQQTMQPSKTNKRNKMVYVIALEEDRYIRDVTARYAKQMGSETMKLRLSSRKSGENFWDDILRQYKRPYKLDRDQREDIELMSAQYREPMPNSLNGFKTHPVYVLERHLKREETLHPRKQIGMFRGEPVFPRTSLVSLKSAETWMREGRQIKKGEQAMKMVKQRAVTINKRRAQELASIEGQETQQGLYALWQTELVVPPPVVDGVVPRNSYGNLDLFAPHMLPEGGAFLPYKGIAKIARKLGVDFADAVTGFEFKQRRAVPVISGIVVPAESKEIVLDAFMAWEQGEYEKEQAKKEERCLKKWGKLIRGLQIRQRLERSYKVKMGERNDSEESSADITRKTPIGLNKRRKINGTESYNQLRNLEFDEDETAYTSIQQEQRRNNAIGRDNNDTPITPDQDQGSSSTRRIPLLSEIWAQQNDGMSGIDDVEMGDSDNRVGETEDNTDEELVEVDVEEKKAKEQLPSKLTTREKQPRLILKLSQKQNEAPTPLQPVSPPQQAKQRKGRSRKNEQPYQPEAYVPPQNTRRKSLRPSTSMRKKSYAEGSD